MNGLCIDCALAHWGKGWVFEGTNFRGSTVFVSQGQSLAQCSATILFFKTWLLSVLPETEYHIIIYAACTA